MNEILLQTINPIAIEIGSLQVRWYGIIIAFGIYLATTLADREECNPSTVPKALKVLEKQGVIVSRGSKVFLLLKVRRK